MKNESGITLVVLVITITLLLILFAAASNQLLGSNGFLAELRSAKNNQNETQRIIQEEINTAKEEERNSLTNTGDKQIIYSNGIDINNETDKTDSVFIGINKNTTNHYAIISLSMNIYKKTISKITFQIREKVGNNETPKPFSIELYDSGNPLNTSYRFDQLNSGKTYEIKINIYDGDGVLCEDYLMTDGTNKYRNGRNSNLITYNKEYYEIPM